MRVLLVLITSTQRETYHFSRAIETSTRGESLRGEHILQALILFFIRRALVGEEGTSVKRRAIRLHRCNCTLRWQEKSQKGNGAAHTYTEAASYGSGILVTVVFVRYKRVRATTSSDRRESQNRDAVSSSPFILHSHFRNIWRGVSQRNTTRKSSIVFRKTLFSFVYAYMTLWFAAERFCH